MKPASSGSRRAAMGSPASQLLEQRSPVVYLGPGAIRALEGEKGILLGAQRPGWVDLLIFESYPGAGWRELVERRFKGRVEWDVVGVVLSRSELVSRESSLVRELVPGDVVLTLPEAAEAAEGPQVFVNLGDRLAPARLKLTRARPTTSSRSRRRYR